jgi:hypothetical protein
MVRLFEPWRLAPRSHHVVMHSTCPDHPTPPLVVIGSARVAPAHATADLGALIASLPPAQRVLWVGAGAQHRARYAAAHPAAACNSMASDATTIPAGPYDLIVLGRDLDAWPDPMPLLQALAREAASGATLALAFTNHATLPMLQRWAEADLTDDDGALTRPQLSLGSWGSVAKLLMDAGWMPTLAHAEAAAPVSPAYERAALDFAASLGIPAATARRQWGLARGVVHARREFEMAQSTGDAARFTVVVPTTRDRQLRANVEHSPGLAEVNARIVSVRRAANPAAALKAAAPHVATDWVLLAHQDVYFPRGFGERLNALLAQVAAADRVHTLIGFAGMGVDREHRGVTPAGFVVDRTTRSDWGANDHAVSIDELALVMPRDGVHRLDPVLGWHLWATDLCLAAITTHKRFARIVRLPVFHNSLTDHRLPEAFHASAAMLAAKYPDWGPIHTLCGVIAPQASQAPRSHAA